MPFTTVAGTRVHYLDSGSGRPALVLLHAFPMHAGMWDDQAAALSDRWRVVAPDMPGFGGTDPPDDPKAVTMDTWADLVVGLIDELGTGPVVVGGLSMGGYLTLSLLRRHRDRLAGVVLADTRASADTPEVAERRTTQQRQVAERGTGELVESMLETLLSDRTRAERPDVVDRGRSIMAANSPAGFVAALEAMKGRPDSTEALARAELPALVVVGEHDGPSPPSVAAEMAEALPQGRMEVMPGAGHLSNLEAPSEFNRAVESFLVGL